MLILPITIDDISPLITYEPAEAWRQGDADSGTSEKHTDYWGTGGSKTWTQMKGASATFKFNGTSIQVKGAKRQNHGNYSVQLDEEVIFRGTGYADPPQYQADLFIRTGLSSDRMHTIVLRSEETFFDIDCITWMSISDKDDEHVYDINPKEVLKDDDAKNQLVYSPEGAWNTNPFQVWEFDGGSGHSTSQLNASVNFTFQGETITVYGTVGPNNAPYEVYLDDALMGSYNATRHIRGARIPLYHASALGRGDHSVSLVNKLEGKVLEFDYAEYIQTPAIKVSPPASRIQPRPRLLPGAIVGIVMACIIFLILVLFIWLLIRRNKALWHRLQSGYMVQSQFDTSSTPSLVPAHTQSASRGISSHTQSASEKSTKYGKNLPDYGDTSYHPPLPPTQRREDGPPRPPRSETLQTFATASTLVAEAGSQMEGSSAASLAPRLTLKLVPRWGTAGLGRLGSVKNPTSPILRSPSRSRLLMREEEGRRDPYHEFSIDPHDEYPMDSPLEHDTGFTRTVLIPPSNARPLLEPQTRT